jgi:fructokinase
VFLEGGRTIHQPAEPIDLVDTVGAGDSFMGSLLAGLENGGAATPRALAQLEDADISAALAFAVHVSAITCSRAGADPPWKYEVTLPVRSSGAKGTR